MRRSELRVGEDSLLVFLDRVVRLSLREELHPPLVVLECLLLLGREDAQNAALSGISDV